MRKLPVSMLYENPGKICCENLQLLNVLTKSAKDAPIYMSPEENHQVGIASSDLSTNIFESQINTHSDTYFIN